MKAGDLVKREIDPARWKSSREQHQRLGYGIVLSTQIGGRNPRHPCATVFWTKAGQVYDIAESLLEVVSESR